MEECVVNETFASCSPSPDSPCSSCTRVCEERDDFVLHYFVIEATCIGVIAASSKPNTPSQVAPLYLTSAVPDLPRLAGVHHRVRRAPLRVFRNRRFAKILPLPRKLDRFASDHALLHRTDLHGHIRLLGQRRQRPCGLANRSLDACLAGGEEEQITVRAACAPSDAEKVFRGGADDCQLCGTDMCRLLFPHALH